MAGNVSKASRDLGMAVNRQPQSGKVEIPPGTTIVSSDGHLNVIEDLWYERRDRAPAHVRDRLPRIAYDEPNGVWQIVLDGKPAFTHPVAQQVVRSVQREGSYDIPKRVAELEAEGVSKELAFPNTVSMLFAYPDLEVREWMFRLYNEFLGVLQKRAPGRFFGVGVLPWWDAKVAAEVLAEAKAHGLKTMMIACNLGNDAKGNKLFVSGDTMDAVWAVIEKAGLPICFHVGESLEPASPVNGMAVRAITTFSCVAFRRIFAELTYGGVLDKYPGLRIVFAEAGLHWIPGMLQDAEMVYDTYGELTGRPEHRPTEYWSRHCYATFMIDPAGMALLDRIGADRVMWSNDYPHNESTFGYGWAAIKAVVDATSKEDSRKILGETALNLFKMN